MFTFAYWGHIDTQIVDSDIIPRVCRHTIEKVWYSTRIFLVCSMKYK